MQAFSKTVFPETTKSNKTNIQVLYNPCNHLQKIKKINHQATKIVAL